MVVRGYFTVERKIIGLTTHEIEHRLGFRRNFLTYGCCVVALAREPEPDEYEPAGSTLFPGGQGVRSLPKFKPGSWLGTRLVKVVSGLSGDHEMYPRCFSLAAEQWRLTVDSFPAYEVCRLRAGDTYWCR